MDIFEGATSQVGRRGSPCKLVKNCQLTLKGSASFFFCGRSRALPFRSILFESFAGSSPRCSSSMSRASEARAEGDPLISNEECRKMSAEKGERMKTGARTTQKFVGRSRVISPLHDNS